MAEPKVSAKGLAEFVFAGAARRRSIVRNFKFPSLGEGVGRAVYYSAALSAIRAYLRAECNPGILADAIQSLELKVQELSGKKANRLKKARAENNIRAIHVYSRQFGDKKFKLLPSPHLRLKIGNVTVTATPDLMVESRGRKFLIKLDLGKKKLTAELIELLLHLFHEAARSARIDVEAENILYLESLTGLTYKCPARSRPLQRTVESGCQAFAEMWEDIPD